MLLCCRCLFSLFFCAASTISIQSNPIGSTIDSVKKSLHSYSNPGIRFWLHYSYTKHKRTDERERVKKNRRPFFQMVIFIRQYNDWKVTKVMEFYEFFLMDCHIVAFDFTARKTTIENCQKLKGNDDKRVRKCWTVIACVSSFVFLW